MMADDTPSEDKSYRDWLAEALAQDEKTWEALEAKLKALRGKHDAGGKKEPPREF